MRQNRCSRSELRPPSSGPSHLNIFCCRFWTTPCILYQYLCTHTIPPRDTLGLILTALSASANRARLPDRSQAAMVQQPRVTDITIRYHRPLVDGRKIWGEPRPFR